MSDRVWGANEHLVAKARFSSTSLALLWHDLWHELSRPQIHCLSTRWLISLSIDSLKNSSSACMVYHTTPLSDHLPCKATQFVGCGRCQIEVLIHCLPSVNPGKIQLVASLLPCGRCQIECGELMSTLWLR